MKHYELSVYRGYPLQIDPDDILVTSPDGKDIAFFKQMSSTRKWVRDHRKRTREADRN